MASQAEGVSTLDKIITALVARGFCPERRQMVPLAYTRQALSKATGVGYHDLASELQRLMSLGYVRTRTHRPSGRTLYKLSDDAQGLFAE